MKRARVFSPDISSSKYSVIAATNPQQYSTEEHDKARRVVNVRNVSTFINNYFVYFRGISTKCFTDLKLKITQITSKKSNIHIIKSYSHS